MHDRSQIDAIAENFWRCIDHIAELSERTGHVLHLGVEPEPLGLFENTEETLAFFARMAERRPGDPRLRLHLGVNYDACHFAIQFEEASESLTAFQGQDIRISKIHLSSALRTTPNESSLADLRPFAEDIYLHQVVARRDQGSFLRYHDLPVALEKNEPADEWRIHFHVPLYAPPIAGLETTIDQALGVLDWLAARPGACNHLEMETYTWAVLPPDLKSASVIDQLVREYEWILPQLAARALLLALSGKLRAWMVLGRISNLPTVWSNCLAGCWLGGWNTPGAVLLLCLGSTLLYTGGMFLNDVCDVDFDAEFRRDRPIVSGCAQPARGDHRGCGIVRRGCGFGRRDQRPQRHVCRWPDNAHHRL